jgi:hypothetical protein
MKDQPMLKFRLLALALAGASFITARCGTVITENFSSDPLLNGWKVFGDTNLFQWDSTNQDLRVTWDSSQPNSYFYHPLGTILARADDFSMAFDLQLTDIGPAPDTDATNTFEIALGFLNLGQASQTNFLRGTGVNSTNLAEFAYFWNSGYGATAWPTFVDTNGNFNWNSSSDYAIFALANGETYHIVVAYAASNQTATATITNSQQTSGVLITQPLDLDTNFLDFRLDTFSINSYSGAGQDPADAGSVLAHGIVGNMVVVVPPPPVENLTESSTNGVWQVQFDGRATWTYTLQRTADFRSWTNLSTITTGSATNLILLDTNRPPDKAFYRVCATRP